MDQIIQEIPENVDDTEMHVKCDKCRTIMWGIIKGPNPPPRRVCEDCYGQ